MTFSGKMLLMIILKVTKNPGFHPLFRRYIFWETTMGGNLTPPSRFKVKGDISKSDSIFPYLQRGAWMITVPKEKYLSFNFISWMSKKVGHI